MVSDTMPLRALRSQSSPLYRLPGSALVLIACTAAVLLTVGLSAVFAWRDRNEAVQQATGVAGNIGLLAAEHASRLIETGDLLLTQTATLAGAAGTPLPDDQATRDRMALLAASAPHMVGLEIRDASGALRHDDEVDDRQNRKHDDTDCVVAADHEFAERLDDFAGRVRTRVAVQQHDTGRGDVQREAQQRREQEHGREDAKVERTQNVENRHHDDERQRDVEREQHIERDRRQWHDHHREHRKHTHGHTEARSQERAEVEGC